MSDDQNSTPPITKPPAGAQTPKAPAPTAAPAPAPAGVSRTALIWIGVAVVVLSFVASFLGATLARSNDANEAVPAPTASETQPSTEEYEAALEEILPAGAAVRAGAGVPESGKGYEGEVYIDISTSDVYLFKDGEWVQVGNIRASAAENLTGETGAAGETGGTGATGETVRRVLRAPRSHWRTDAPGGTSRARRTVTSTSTSTPTAAQFYECTDEAWTLVWPPTAQGATPTPTTDSNG